MILTWQARILELLCPQEAKRFAELGEAYASGYEAMYLRGFPELSDEVLSDEACREVIDVLNMFSAIKKAQPGWPASIPVERLKFNGFDGNSETKRFAFASYFCGLNGGRYKNLDRGDDFNSHEPMLGRYRRMLERRRLCEDKNNLTASDLERIASA
jgi:hypothetical protein